MAQPIDAVVSGVALETEGFVGIQFAVAGLGLNTFGFLWPCDGIWTTSDLPITTTWTCGISSPSDNIETCSGID